MAYRPFLFSCAESINRFLGEELGWTQNKVDDLLLPIIQKMGKRGKVNNTSKTCNSSSTHYYRQEAALNKQGTLNGFFDMSVGTGAYAPRKRQPYASKRLQKVVSEFRKEQARSTDRTDEDEETEPVVGKRPRITKKAEFGGSGRGGPRRRKRRVGGGSEEEEYRGSDVVVPLRVELRPRAQQRVEGMNDSE